MSSPWRSFSPEIEEIAAKCAINPITDEPFTCDGAPVGGAGTTARRVTMNESGAKAWAKPARDNPGDINCAAHEKIASDLGQLLGLPIPPVSLSRRTAGTGMAPVVAISYEALPQGRPWAQAENLLTPEIKATIRATMSAMWAFHAWVNDSDHNWNPGNIIVELHATEPTRLAFIDYSFALSKYWNPPAPPVAPMPLFPWHERPGDYAPCDDAAMHEIITRIEKLSLRDFDTLIKRIPADCLATELAGRLVDGLEARRHDLRKILNFKGGAP